MAVTMRTEHCLLDPADLADFLFQFTNFQVELGRELHSHLDQLAGGLELLVKLVRPRLPAVHSSFRSIHPSFRPIHPSIRPIHPSHGLSMALLPALVHLIATLRHGMEEGFRARETAFDLWTHA